MFSHSDLSAVTDHKEEHMKIEKAVDEQIMTLTFEGWLDTQAAPELENVLKETGDDIKKIVFDCKKLEYISSSGIRQIVAAYKQMNGNLVLRNVSSDIKDVLNMTGISKRVNIE